MARRTKEDAEKTYHALLDAATQLFNDQGVTKTTLNEIAAAAGMTRGAVYWHFDNKDAVIKALWERSAMPTSSKFIHSLNNLSQSDPIEEFITTLQQILRGAFSDPNLNQALRIITSSIEFTNYSSDLQTFLRQRKDEFYDSLSNAVSYLNTQGKLKDSISPELITNGLWAFFTGILRTHLEMDHNKVNIALHCDELIETYVNAMVTN